MSPRAWEGAISHDAPPRLGCGLARREHRRLFPAYLGLRHPGEVITRHAIAAAQMLMGALLIHLSGGRIETHFHVFGSLAFMAMYRDWKVLVTATVIVAADHILRGAFWPASIYGVVAAGHWRWVEHAWWVVFEDVFLIASSIASRQEMWSIASRHAQLEAQAEIERSYANERSANRAKSEFLANMSHEIRTPMTAILGYADLLLEPRLDVSDRLNYIQIIRRNSGHLLSIINDILDLSKIEAGKMTVEKIACSPAQILVEVASLMRVRATEKGLDFDIEYATPMPATMKSDPTRLRQILLNLVGNAIKFTQSGSVRIIARCHDVDSATPTLTFEVADTGVGLSKEQQTKLFQPFAQADSSTTRRYGGSGLGLVICRRLAALLGGDIALESLFGRGSSFTLRVQTGSIAGVTMIANLREAGVPLLMSGTTLPQRELKGSVLLAEDGLDNQLLIATHLRKAGLRVVIAENGRVALEEALAAEQDGRPFDLIFMDMQMPELDGYGATAKLRSRDYARPIVALTAHAMTGDRERCLQAGCDDYMTKPIDRPALLAMAERYIPQAAAPAAQDASLQLVAAATADDDRIVSVYADDPDMAELVEAFVASLHEKRNAIASAAREADLEPLRRLAHQLKGAGGGYGFPSLTSAAGLVEALVGQPGDRAELARTVEALLVTMDRAMIPKTSSPSASPILKSVG